MIVMGILLSIAGLGALCWLLFNLAVFALPFFAGMSAGLYAHHAGAGPIGAIVVGITVAVVALVIGQAIFTFAPSPIVRGFVALVFAAPAAFAGYHAAHGLAGLMTSDALWRSGFGWIGALTVGVTALTRMALPTTGPRRFITPSRLSSAD